MIPNQPNNPTKRERHNLMKYALDEKFRPEDFEDIVSLLSPPKEITKLASPGEFKDVKIGIIGGGTAGLSAAFELRKLGFDITIFEAESNRIGGRVYTYYFDKDKSLYGEFGAMRVPVSHESTWHYIDLFKLNTTKYTQYNKNSFVYAHNTRVRNTDENIMKYIYPKYNLRSWEKKIPFSKILASVYNTPIVNLPHYLRKQLLQIREFYNPEILFFDSINLRKAFKMLGYSEGVIDLVQSVAALDRGLFNYSYLEALREEYPVNFSFLYQIEGGAVNLPLALYNSLVDKNPKEYDINPDHLGKVNWKNGCLVNGIYLNKNKTKVIIKYSDKFLNKSKLEAFDYIICTIPFSSLRNVDIFPSFCNKKMQAIRELNYVNSQKTLFLCDKKFWLEGTKDEKILGGGSYTDLPISTIWYPSNSFDKNYDSKDSPGVLLSSYNIDLDSTRIGNLNNTRKLKQIKSQVEKVHGLPNKYLDNIVKDYKSITWDNEEFFFGDFSIFYPELTRLYAYSNTIPEFNNKVFFAGEHISSTHAWQQGAFKTGMEAANSLAKTCKLNK